MIRGRETSFEGNTPTHAQDIVKERFGYPLPEVGWDRNKEKSQFKRVNSTSEEKLRRINAPKET